MAAFHQTAPRWLGQFYDAYVNADADGLERSLHDDVTWLISGPADHVDLFGLRRGKAAVIELVTRIIPCYQQLAGFEIQHVLVQGENAATFGRVCSWRTETKHPIRFGYAHFLRFQDGRLISLRAVADSFDAMEQFMGCRIEVTTGHGPLAADGDVLAV